MAPTRRSRAPSPHQLPLFPEAEPPAPSLPEVITHLAPAVEGYLATLAGARRPQHTVKTVADDLRGLLASLGDVPLQTIELRHLADHVARLRSERRNTPRSLRRKIAIVKSFFRWLHGQGYLATDPSAGLAYPAAPPRNPPFLWPEEAVRLVDAALSNSYWLAMVLTMLDAGLKRDELLALHVDDLLLPSPRAGTSAEARGHGYLTVRRSAAASRPRPRTLPLTRRLATALRRYLAEHAPADRLFPATARGVNFIVETCGQRAGLTRFRRVTPQMLRDSFGAWAMAERMAREREALERATSDAEVARLRERHNQEVADLLGLHDEVTATARYRALAAELLRHAAPPVWDGP
jgi:integrase